MTKSADEVAEFWGLKKPPDPQSGMISVSSDAGPDPDPKREGKPGFSKIDQMVGSFLTKAFDPAQSVFVKQHKRCQNVAGATADTSPEKIFVKLHQIEGKSPDEFVKDLDEQNFAQKKPDRDLIIKNAMAAIQKKIDGLEPFQFVREHYVLVQSKQQGPFNKPSPVDPPELQLQSAVTFVVEGGPKEDGPFAKGRSRLVDVFVRLVCVNGEDWSAYGVHRTN